MELFDFRLRKSVHVSILIDTHKELRKQLIDKELSMQEVFQKFSELIVSGDKRAQKMLEELLKEKSEGLRPRAGKILNKTSIEDIYALIGENTLSKNTKTGTTNVDD